MKEYLAQNFVTVVRVGARRVVRRTCPTACREADDPAIAVELNSFRQRVLEEDGMRCVCAGVHKARRAWKAGTRGGA
jgi:hypothetical protein